jgi:hypothetical protein
MSPFTSSFVPGVVVPMPRFPWSVSTIWICCVVVPKGVVLKLMYVLCAVSVQGSFALKITPARPPGENPVAP